MAENVEPVVEQQAPRKYQRKQLLINPQFQIKILNYVTGLNLTLLAIFTSVNLMFFERMKAQGISAGLPENHIYFEFLKSQRKDMFIIFLIGAALSVIIIYWFGFYISNKIAGPIYNATRNMERMIRGEKIMKIRFRKGDFFPELADKINELVDALTNKKQ